MRALSPLAALLAALLTAACAGIPAGGGTESSAPTAMLGETPLPPGARLLHEQSLIIGSGENWVGRVVLEAGRDANAAYGYFLEQYPQRGWALQVSVRGKTSLLVFTREGRSAMVEIAEGALMGAATVTLTMVPKDARVSAPLKPGAQR